MMVYLITIPMLDIFQKPLGEFDSSFGHLMEAPRLRWVAIDKKELSICVFWAEAISQPSTVSLVIEAAANTCFITPEKQSFDTSTLKSIMIRKYPFP